MDDPLNPRNLADPSVVLSISPVNYKAWQEGYLPPSEHVLIHSLIYDGAKVLTSLRYEKFCFWVVTRGNIPTGTKGKLFVHMIESQMGYLMTDLAKQVDEISTDVGWSI